MSKKTISTKKMSIEAKQIFSAYSNIVYRNAVTMEKVSALRAEIKSAIEAHSMLIDSALQQGETIDSALAGLSRVELDNRARILEERVKKYKKTVKQAKNACYAIIPEGLYSAYALKITEGKRGEYLTAISDFLQNCGIDRLSSADSVKFAERVSDLIGVRRATDKRVRELKKFTDTQTQTAFKDLFCRAICDLMIADGTLNVPNEICMIDFETK